MFWKKKKATQSSSPKSPVVQVLDGVIYSTDTARKYSITPEETAFFEAFYAALQAARKSTFCKITRMADGSLSVSSSKAYLGKIKLQGRKTRMQYMTGTYNSRTVDDRPLEVYIDLLNHWVKSA